MTFPDVAGYVAFHSRCKKPKNLDSKKDDIFEAFMEKIKAHKGARKKGQKKLWSLLKNVQKAEIEARKRAGYKFE